MKAFPLEQVPGYPESRQRGMELRDYFAAKALTVIPFMAEKVFQNESSWAEKEIAQEAYRLADAMLEERNKNTQ